MSDLEELVPLMSALQDAKIDDVRPGLVAALGEELAGELCDGAKDMSEVATRFFQFRERLLLEDALSVVRTLRGPPRPR